jgi:sec-independent protein translocase protein TatB
MFDIGFSEMLVIAVVALIVIGPERLPKVARTLGHLFGRMQRYVNDVKADISREMELEELRKLQTTIQDAAQSFEQSVRSEVSATESQLQKIAQEANPLPAEQDGTLPAMPQVAAPGLSPQPDPNVPPLPHTVAHGASEQPGPTLPLVAEAADPKPPGDSAPGLLTPAESKAQLSLDLTASPVPADKPV